MHAAPPDGFHPIQIQNGFAAIFGPIYVRRQGEQVSMGFRVDERHINISGVCHGGALATFADLQLAALQRTGAVERGHYPTISLAVDYLAPAAHGDWVEIDVTLVKRTRRLAFTQGVLRTQAGPVVRTTALYSAPAEPRSGGAVALPPRPAPPGTGCPVRRSSNTPPGCGVSHPGCSVH